jgi:hypothetical protein
MSDINKVIITGRVTRDSELRTTPNGTAVADVSVVSNRVWSKAGDRQEESTFVEVSKGLHIAALYFCKDIIMESILFDPLFWWCAIETEYEIEEEGFYYEED